MFRIHVKKVFNLNAIEIQQWKEINKTSKICVGKWQSAHFSGNINVFYGLEHCYMICPLRYTSLSHTSPKPCTQENLEP